MKIAVLMIFYGGLVWGFWVFYELIKHYQGEKIKAYLDEQKYKAQVLKDYADVEFQRKAKIAKQNEVIEVEVEDYDNVVYYNERPKRTPTVIVLEINANKLQSPTQ